MGPWQMGSASLRGPPTSWLLRTVISSLKHGSGDSLQALSPFIGCVSKQYVYFFRRVSAGII